MSGMHCDYCARLFVYDEEVIALHRDEGELIADRTLEKEGGSVGETFQPWRKYHAACYEHMREKHPGEWPALS